MEARVRVRMERMRRKGDRASKRGVRRVRAFGRATGEGAGASGGVDSGDPLDSLVSVAA